MNTAETYLTRISRSASFFAACFFLAALGHTLQVIYVLAPRTLVYALWLALRRSVKLRK